MKHLAYFRSVAATERRGYSDLLI